jgi:hypothetical protein
MFQKFIVLQWKTVYRSPIWQKNLALNILVGFFLFLFALYLLLLGLLIEKILNEMLPGRDHFDFLNGLVLYYLLGDLFIRFMMQSLPKITIEAFLHLPIRKKRFIHFMVSRTILDPFNFLPLLIFIPVTIKLVMPAVGTLQAFTWIFSLFLLILANNFLGTYLKRILGTKPSIIGGIGLVLIALIILDRSDIISLSLFSSRLFGYITMHPAVTIIPLLWMSFTYYIHFNFLKVHLYPDEMQIRQDIEIETTLTNRYLKSLGLTGSILKMELKLYWRNKRTRTIIYMLPIFLLYGLLFYPNKVYMNQNGFLMFVGVFMTGGMMLNYANYAFGYESGYFDALLTKNVDFKHFITVKFYISVLICVFCFILTIPYVFYGYKILLINTSMFLYNIGVLSFTLLYLATFNKKRIDLSRGGAFNYQGIGAMNWLAILPAFLLPVLVYLPFSLTGFPNTGIAFIGFLGLLGLFLRKFFIRIIFQNYCKQKYIMATAFRERS